MFFRRFSLHLKNFKNVSKGNVLLNTLFAGWEFSDRKSSVQKIEAHNWILQESRDYREVCEWALLDPEEMKEHYISALKRKVIAFTKKQVRWAEYNKIYKVLFCDISVEQKKMIRRRLDELRREIHDTATSYTDSIILEAL